ncbi:MAG: hypothetical protein J5I92_10570 [Thiogranum sp.]|nr:hypothetical protein [Thiogranum sp.]
MKQRAKLLPLTACLALSAASLPAFGDLACPPNPGAVTVDDNIQVAAACRLDGTTVKGNVLLYGGGSLVARDAHIDGNIQTQSAGAYYVDVERTRVIGDIQLDGMVGDPSLIVSNDVDGNIQLDSNSSRMEVRSNEVGGDVQAFSNFGGVVVTGNVIDGNLQCKSNMPAPVGGDNRVSGNIEDQCVAMQPESSLVPDPATGSATGSEPLQDSGGGGNTGVAALLAMLLAFALRPARPRIADPLRR